jgi:integrase
VGPARIELATKRLRFPKRWLTRRWDASMVQLMLNTGLCLDEVLRMRTDDVELTHSKEGGSNRAG